MVTNKIISAIPQGDYRVFVTFKNGIKGIFDMSQYLDLGVFQKLKDPVFFKAVRVEYGTLVWPEEIDIAPDTVEADLISGNQVLA